MRKVREFVARDPASALRAAVDRARIARGADELAQVLAERIEERALLKARLADAEQSRGAGAAHRQAARGLALAEKLLAERDARILGSAKSRGCAPAWISAEALAFARAREIEESAPILGLEVPGSSCCG